MAIDLPLPSTVVRQPFAVAGWALDLAASDNGIDAVHVYAYPATGAPPIFIGASGISVSRPDVGGVFGANHTTSGYGIIVRGLAAGDYTIVVFAHSSFGAGFPVAQAVSVRIEQTAAVVIDTPGQSAQVPSSFQVAGWAADFGAASGGGIDIVHVYAYPLDAPGAPVFLGQGSVNVARPDVAAVFGSAYGRSGYSLLARPLPPGQYQVVVFGRSMASGTFDVTAWRIVTVR